MSDKSTGKAMSKKRVLQIRIAKEVAIRRRLRRLCAKLHLDIDSEAAQDLLSHLRRGVDIRVQGDDKER